MIDVDNRAFNRFAGIFAYAVLHDKTAKAFPLRGRRAMAIKTN